MSNDDLPRLSKAEEIILSILISRVDAMYGWDMVKISEGKLNLNGIYTTLNRMEDKGYIESEKEQQRTNARGRPRRLYRITGYGLRVHSAWTAANAAWLEGAAL